jgi:hypothetical protein
MSQSSRTPSPIKNHFMKYSFILLTALLLASLAALQVARRHRAVFV